MERVTMRLNENAFSKSLANGQPGSEKTTRVERLHSKRHQGASNGCLPREPLAVALEFADAGFAVFPCRERGGRGDIKSPYTTNGFKAATTDREQIRRWWKKWPRALIGLPTGMNGIAVLDLDRKNGKNGDFELLDRGLLHRAKVSVRTPSGGKHLIFKDLDGLTPTTGKLPNGKAIANVDVRAAGSYIIAPGSILADGRAYEYERGSLIDTALSDWPDDDEYQPLRRGAVNDNAAHDFSDWSVDLVQSLVSAVQQLPAMENGDRPYIENRDGNTKLGMALHHWSNGSAEGFDMWHEHSKLSKRYKSRSVYEADWRTFGRGCNRNPVTLASFIEAVGGKGGDWYWYNIRLKELADEFDDPEERPQTKKSRLTFLTPTDCEIADTRDYVVKGVLAPYDVAVIFGAPGVGKSLCAPHIAYAVAQGRPVLGARVKPGMVFYVAAEDDVGMRSRVRALKERWGDAPIFRLVSGCSDLLNKRSADMDALLAAVKAHRPSLVVIDTLTMAFPGLEENDASSMSRVVSVGRKLAEFGAAVIFVHHDTKEGGDTPRGHSVLNGALDMALHLSKGEDGVVRGQLTKNRNGTCDQDIAFRIGIRSFGEDEDGDPITAALVEELETDQQPKVRLGAPAKAALAILETSGGSASEKGWREKCVAGRDVSAADKLDSRRKATSRAIKELVGAGAVLFDDGVYSVPIAKPDWGDENDL